MTSKAEARCLIEVEEQEEDLHQVEIHLMIQVWSESSHPLQLSQLDFSELCQTTQIMLQYSGLVIFILIAS